MGWSRSRTYDKPSSHARPDVTTSGASTLFRHDEVLDWDLIRQLKLKCCQCVDWDGVAGGCRGKKLPGEC